jgi:hypothetical protein
LSPYSACNFMNSASDSSSIRGMFVIPLPSTAFRKFADQENQGLMPLR